MMPASLLTIAKPKTYDVTLITYTNARLALQLAVLYEDFVYAGKLWALNREFTKAAGSPHYCEINEAVCKEVRDNAGMSMQIAARWEAQLESLKEPMKQ